MTHTDHAQRLAQGIAHLELIAQQNWPTPETITHTSQRALNTGAALVCFILSLPLWLGSETLRLRLMLNALSALVFVMISCALIHFAHRNYTQQLRTILSEHAAIAAEAAQHLHGFEDQARFNSLKRLLGRHQLLADSLQQTYHLSGAAVTAPAQVSR